MTTPFKPSIPVSTVEASCDGSMRPIGLVRGNVCMSRNVVKDLMGSLKTLVGGEITTWTDLMVESRDIALERLVAEAERLGADAVTGVRFSSNFIEDVVEVLAYGTAVKAR